MTAPPAIPDEETDTQIRPPGDSGNISIGSAVPLSPEVTQPVNSDEIAAWADSLVGKVPDIDPSSSGAAASGPWPTPGIPAPAELAGLGPPAERSDPNASTARLEPGKYEVGPPDFSELSGTEIGPPAEPFEPPQLPSLPGAARPPEAEALAGHTVPTRAIDPSAPDPIPSADSSLPGSALDDDLEDVSFVGGGRFSRAIATPKGLAVVGGSALVILFIAVALMAAGDDDDKGKVAADTNRAKSEAKADKADAKSTAADDASKAKAKADDGASADDPDGDDDDAALDPPPPPPPPGADDDAAEPLPATKLSQPLPEEPDVVPPDPAAVAATPGPGEAVIAAALSDREVRALDIFIVSPESGDGTFDEAQAYCAGLEVAGIGGWRLPSAGELNSLAKAKLITRGVYWSRTLGDIFGDTRLVINAKKDRLSAAPTSWGGGAAICLRPRS